MAKTKLHKYERLGDLPNVTHSYYGEPPTPDLYPWYQAPFTDMKKILELGCGKGEHSLAFAAAEDLFCIGLDIKGARICVGAERAMAAGQTNVHFLKAQVECIRELFEEQSIAEIWLTFPDPHLRRRSSKNRLTSPAFLDTYAHLLVPGGTVHLKTDCDTLFEYSRDSVEKWGGRIVSSSENIHEGETVVPRRRVAVSAFEEEARAQGKTIKYMAFSLKR